MNKKIIAITLQAENFDGKFENYGSKIGSKFFFIALEEKVSGLVSLRWKKF